MAFAKRTEASYPIKTPIAKLFQDTFSFSATESNAVKTGEPGWMIPEITPSSNSAICELIPLISKAVCKDAFCL